MSALYRQGVNELAKFGFRSQPFDTAVMDRCLKQFTESDLAILRHFKEGKKHPEIAAPMATDVESVRSLVRTYVDLRIKMMGCQTMLAALVPQHFAQTGSWLRSALDWRR